MQTVLFMIPMKPGKMAEYQKCVAEITGPKKQDYLDLLKRYGFKTAKIWHHKIADKEYLITMHDIESDAMERMKNWTTSTHPFDQWFNQQCLNFYAMESFDKMPAQPEFVYGVATTSS